MDSSLIDNLEHIDNDKGNWADVVKKTSFLLTAFFFQSEGGYTTSSAKGLSWKEKPQERRC